MPDQVVAAASVPAPDGASHSTLRTPYSLCTLSHTHTVRHTCHVRLQLVGGVHADLAHLAPDVPRGLSSAELRPALLQLPQHGLRLHLARVPAAHQVVLQHGAAREREVADLHTTPRTALILYSTQSEISSCITTVQ